MNPKLLRMYSDILGEQAATPQTPSQSQIATGMAKQAQLVQSRNKPATNSMAARGKVDAMKGSQASDTQTSMTLGGPTGATKSGASPAATPAATPVTPPPAAGDQSGGSTTGNKAFLPGAAGGAPATPPAAAAPQVAADVAAGQNIGGKFAAAASQKAAQDSFAQLSGMAPTVQSQPTAATPAASTPAAASADNGLAQNPSIVSPEVGKAQASSQATAPAQPKGVFSNPTPAAAPMKTAQDFTSPSAAPAPTVSTGTGGTLTSGSGKAVTSTDFSQPQTDAMGRRINEVNLEEDDDIEEQIEEAFNDMLRLSGIRLNEKAPPGAKAERMVKHIKKGYAKDGKITPKEKSIAYATAWKAKKAGKLDEGLNLMLDEGGQALDHIANRFKYEVKMFMRTGIMDNDLYEALADYYVARGEVPYGVVKGKPGFPDQTQWVEKRFTADMNNSMNEAPVYEVAADDGTLNELARLAGLSESRVDECGDMGMDIEDRLNVSTNMSSDGTKSINISAQGEKADELLSMLKLAGMGGSDRPAMVMIDRDEEMMEREEAPVPDDGNVGGPPRQFVDVDEERETEYANTPEEEYETVDRIIRQGNDLNREKKQFANMPKAGDNPMAEGVVDPDLDAMLESILIRDDKMTKDPQTGRVRMTFPPPQKSSAPDQSKLPLQSEPFHGPRSLKTDKEKTGTEKEVDEGSIKKGGPNDLTGTWSSDPPEKGQPDVPPPVPMDPVYPNAKNINRPEPQMKNMPLPKNSPEPQTKNMPRPKNAPEPRMKPMQRN